MRLDIEPAALGRLPPPMQQFLLRRGQWSLCAMEHSRIGAIHVEDPGVPFHHLSLPLGGTPPRLGMRVEGRRLYAGSGADTIGVIEAHVGGTSWWDGPFESACFYFTPRALDIVLGLEVGSQADIHCTLDRHAPLAAHLLRVLHADAAAGQPHGNLVGDAVFAALAVQFVPALRIGTGPSGSDWRVRRALEYIHVHLAGKLGLPAIAEAAATSPFHLSRAFRAGLGCSIWQYVLRERARRAMALMRHPGMGLAQVAQSSGFDTYASFVMAVRREYGVVPFELRRTL